MNQEIVSLLNEANRKLINVELELDELHLALVRLEQQLLGK